MNTGAKCLLTDILSRLFQYKGSNKSIGKIYIHNLYRLIDLRAVFSLNRFIYATATQQIYGESTVSKLLKDELHISKLRCQPCFMEMNMVTFVPSEYIMPTILFSIDYGIISFKGFVKLISIINKLYLNLTEGKVNNSILTKTAE